MLRRSPAQKSGKLIVALLLVVLLSGFLFFAPTWETINRDIARKYPQVPTISTDQLKVKIEKSSPPVILDVRSGQEFAVSHLPGAIHEEHPKAVSLQKNTPIVVYCSVGIRSAAFAAELLSLGYTKVVNLKGSIFEWANKGYPLVRKLDEPVTVVHPYNTTWGKLLNRELHEYKLQ